MTSWVWIIRIRFLNSSMNWWWSLTEMTFSACIGVMSNRFGPYSGSKLSWWTIRRNHNVNIINLNLFNIEVWINSPPRDHEFIRRIIYTILIIGELKAISVVIYCNMIIIGFLISFLLCKLQLHFMRILINVN